MTLVSAAEASTDPARRSGPAKEGSPARPGRIPPRRRGLLYGPGPPPGGGGAPHRPWLVRPLPAAGAARPRGGVGEVCFPGPGASAAVAAAAA